MLESVRSVRLSRLATYGLCGVMVLGGPGFLATGVLLDANVWACIAIAAVLSVVLIPLGLMLGHDVRRSRAPQRRFAERSRAGS